MTTRKKIIAAATALTVATGVNATPAQAQTLPPVPAANSSASEGYLVAGGTALLAIAITLGLIIGSDVRGANKIIDATNRHTGGNTPHLNQPFPELLGH